MIDKNYWERQINLCIDAKQKMKNKSLTAAGLHGFLRHLPKNTTYPEEYTIIPETIAELYKYAKYMFNYSPEEAQSGDIGHDVSYHLAMAMHNQSFIGSICGDIIGSPYEFNNTKSTDFKLFTSKSKFTDDTVMTCAVADWLMNDSKHTHNGLIKIIHKYGKKYPKVSYGNSFRVWLETNQIKPYNSFGNGSAMRVSPVGFYASSLDEALKLAKISAEVTHNHPEGIKGAQAVATAIYLMKKASIDGSINLFEIKKFIEERFSYRLTYTEEEWKEHSKNYHFDETCQGSVPESIYCVFNSKNYEQVIRKVISLGGDADTQAAIAGGIASAYYPVPLDIIAECLKIIPDDLRELIYEFNYFVS